MITKEEFYAALEQKHGKELQEKFINASVAICGLGGLGSNIAVCLARAGVGKLHIIDFDRLEPTNLNRQQYFVRQLGMYKAEALKENLLEINPFIEVKTDIVKITDENIKELLQNENIICEAFDGAENKAMLVNAVLENYSEKYLVSGSGMAGMSSANKIKTRQVMKRFFISGDETSDVATEDSLVSARVMVCAAHEAQIALQIIAGKIPEF